MIKKLLWIIGVSLSVLILSLLVFAILNKGTNICMPVVGAPRVGHKHKGVDIFAPKGRPVVSAISGFLFLLALRVCRLLQLPALL